MRGKERTKSPELEEIKKQSKKTIVIIAIVMIFTFLLSMGGVYVGFKYNIIPLGQIQNKTSSTKVDKVYSSDISSDVYRIGSTSHMVKLGITLIFNNEDDRKLYDNLNPRDTIPNKKENELSYGDKKVKDILINTINGLNLDSISDINQLKSILISNVNKKYSRPIVKDILTTNYFVQ